MGNKSGAAGQDELWGYIEDGIVVIHNPSEAEQKRMRVLMKKYRDPKKNRLMDIGDASLVAAAEALKLTRIFTLDSQFSNSYRIDDKTSFELIL